LSPPPCLPPTPRQIHAPLLDLNSPFDEGMLTLDIAEEAKRLMRDLEGPQAAGT
jgi:hypothetical protein